MIRRNSGGGEVRTSTSLVVAESGTAMVAEEGAAVVVGMVVAVVGERWYAGGEEEDEVREEGRGRVVVEEDVVYPEIDEHETRATTTKKRSWRSSPRVGRVVAEVEDEVALMARVAVGTREPEGTNGRNTTDTPTTKQVTTTTRVITPRMGIIMTTVMGTTTTSRIPIRIIIPRVDEEEVGVVASDGDAGVVDAVADEVPVMPVHRKTAAMLPPTSSHRTVQTRLLVRRRPRRATIPHR